jgi:nicotinamidase-related amidase
VIARLSAEHSLLLLVDMQTSMMPAIPDAQAQIATADRLARGAKVLGVPVHATEHVSEKLGVTVQSLQRHLSLSPNAVLQKRYFDGCLEKASAALIPTQRRQVLIAGAETHVCVMQTALSLLDRGLEVWIVTDACGSRHANDKTAALDRLSRAGAFLITAEMALFEWLGGADHPQFRDVLAIIKSRDAGL